MKRFLNIAVRILVILLVIYMIGATLLSYFVKPDTYKKLISEAVYNKTGMELMIRGKLDFKFFPWLGVRVQTMQLDNPKDFKAPANVHYFVQVGQAGARLAFLPLFRGRIEPTKIVLSNTIINLVTNKSGQSNWQKLLERPAAPSKTDKESMSPEDKSKRLAKAHFKFPTIVIKNANLVWINQQANETIKLRKFNLTAGPVHGGEKLKLYSDFNFSDNHPAIDLSIHAEALADARLQQKIFKLDDLQIKGQISRYAQHITRPVKFGLSGNFDLYQRDNRIVIGNIKARFANLNFSGNITGENIMADSVYKGTVTMPTFNLQQFLDAININYRPSNSSMSQKMRGKLQFKLTNDGISLSNFFVNLDNSNLQGSFAYLNMNQRKLTFTVELDQINLDDYAPVSTGQATKVAKKSNNVAANDSNTATSTASHGDFNLRAMRDWDWQGNFKASQIIWRGVKLHNVVMNTTAQANKISIKPVNANVDTGNISLRADADISQSTPQINAVFTSYNLPLATLMKLMQSKLPLQGVLSLRTTLRTQGNTQQAWRNNLSGDGKITVVNGQLDGINLNKAINIGMVALKKRPVALKTDRNVTLFENINASFTINNGILSNDDLEMVSTSMIANGKGRINLRTMHYDPYRIQAAAKSDSNLLIPIIITGPLASPHVQVDIATLTGGMLKNVIKKELQKIPGQPFKNFKLDKLLPF